MKKILSNFQHFDMTPFFEWEMKVLPLALNWFDRARSIEINGAYTFVANRDHEAQHLKTRIAELELDAIYQFILANAGVFESAVYLCKDK